MDDRQTTARKYIDADLEEAIRAIDDVVKLLPHAGLPKSPKFDSELSNARAALTRARRIAADLARQNANEETR